jgi:sugar phosphate isomerase/epimerase
MKELGCNYVDYPIEGNEDESELMRINKEINDAGLRVHQVHGPFPYPPHDELPEDRERRKEEMRGSIRRAALMGAKYWVIHPFFPFGQAGANPEGVIKINEECFRDLLPCAKENGVIICFENMPFKDFPLSLPRETLDFIHLINDENFKFCLDTGHANMLGTSPADAVRMAGNDLKVLHVHDNDGTDDHHGIPYTGTTNWNEFMKALREVGYTGPISSEAKFVTGDGKSFLKGAPDEVKFQCLKAMFSCLLAEK